MQKYYKDIKATLILITMVSIFGGFIYFVIHATPQQGEMLIKTLGVMFAIVTLFAFWKLIRMLLD